MIIILLLLYRPTRSHYFRTISLATVRFLKQETLKLMMRFTSTFPSV